MSTKHERPDLFAEELAPIQLVVEKDTVDVCIPGPKCLVIRVVYLIEISELEIPGLLEIEIASSVPVTGRGPFWR